MEIELKSFTPAEQATFRLRALYEQAGYRKYRASRFEEYALYQESTSAFCRTRRSSPLPTWTAVCWPSSRT